MTNTHQRPEPVVIREGSALYNPDEVARNLIWDANDLTGFYTRQPDEDRERFDAINEIIGGDGALEDDDREFLDDLCRDADDDLAAHGYEVEWEDGYVIFPPAAPNTPIIWPAVDDLAGIITTLDAAVAGLRADGTAGGSAERWHAIDALEHAARLVFSAVHQVRTAPDNPSSVAAVG